MIRPCENRRRHRVSGQCRQAQVTAAAGGRGRGWLNEAPSRAVPRPSGEGLLEPCCAVEVGEALEVAGQGNKAELGFGLRAAAQEEAAAVQPALEGAERGLDALRALVHEGGLGLQVPGDALEGGFVDQAEDGALLGPGALRLEGAGAAVRFLAV
jgi:hypothetical protein